MHHNNEITIPDSTNLGQKARKFSEKLISKCKGHLFHASNAASETQETINSKVHTI